LLWYTSLPVSEIVNLPTQRNASNATPSANRKSRTRRLQRLPVERLREEIALAQEHEVARLDEAPSLLSLATSVDLPVARSSNWMEVPWSTSEVWEPVR
jgi:hypothetical protein